MFVTALYEVSSAIASSYSLSITFACAAERGEMSHWNGSGVELNPSENAKLDQLDPQPFHRFDATNGHYSHVNLDMLPVFILGRLDVKRPQHARDVDGHRRRAEVHSWAHAAAPAKRAVAQLAGVLPLLQEALRPELVWLREVGLVEMDCRL